MRAVLVWNGRIADPTPAKRDAFGGVGVDTDRASRSGHGGNRLEHPPDARSVPTPDRRRTGHAPAA
jgi:hypothetical protein